MTNDDHAALIEVEGQLDELRARQSEAEDAADRSQLQAQIDAAEAERVESCAAPTPRTCRSLAAAQNEWFGWKPLRYTANAAATLSFPAPLPAQ